MNPLDLIPAGLERRGISAGVAIAGFLAGLLLICLVVWLFFLKPSQDRQRAAQGHVDAAEARAGQESAREAGTISDAARNAEAASDQTSRENADVIRAAPGATQPLDPGLNAVGRERVCLRPSYRNSPECVRLLGGAKPAG